MVMSGSTNASLPPLLAPRPLGKTGIQVSALGLGTVKFGRREGVKYPEPFNIPGDRMALRLLADARDAGVALLDTAPAYGTAEARLGGLLSGWRDLWTIVTKAGETFEDGASNFDFRPEAIIASIERSLERLRTDRVECALLHCADDDEAVLRAGALHALSRCKEEGKARAIGASVKTPVAGMLAIEQGADAIMVELSPGREAMLPVIEAARAAGVGVLIKKALASGHAATGADPASAVRHSIGFALSQPGVTSVILGTINRDHLASNIEAARVSLKKV